MITIRTTGKLFWKRTEVIVENMKVEMKGPGPFINLQNIGKKVDVTVRNNEVVTKNS